MPRHARIRREAFPLQVRERATRSLIYLVLSLAFIAIAAGVYRSGLQISKLSSEDIQLKDLPFALTLSFMRMGASYLACLALAFPVGIFAARSKLGERLILPLLDVGQSAPIVAFFPVVIGLFIGLSNGHRFGIELAATFLIFTCQFWNMGYAVYEVVKSAPDEMFSAVRSFGIEGSLRFFRYYGPLCIPRLIYNSILSWSNGWFFLVAAEIIAVGPMRYNLPGIGSFLSRAAEQGDLTLVGWGLVSLTSLILTLDFLIWRPLSRWSQRFQLEGSGDERRNIFFRLPGRSGRRKRLSELRRNWNAVVQALTYPVVWALMEVIVPLFWDLPYAMLRAGWKEVRLRFISPISLKFQKVASISPWIERAILGGVFVTVIGTLVFVLKGYLGPPWPVGAEKIPVAIVYSTIRVTIAMLLSFAWIVPLILICWNRPALRQTLLTLAQVGASLPATALFPLFVLVVVQRLGGGIEVASLLLLMSGMQWYILFNGLSGASQLSRDLVEVTRSFGLQGPTLWKRLVLPAVTPTLLTGAVTAWGGGWNALVVCEYFVSRDKVNEIPGIGSMLSHAVYQSGDPRMIALCSAAIVGWVILIDLSLWQALFRRVLTKYGHESP